MKDEPGKQFSLRLGRSLKDLAIAMAKRDDVSLNHFISLAVSEKVSRIRVGLCMPRIVCQRSGSRVEHAECRRPVCLKPPRREAVVRMGDLPFDFNC
jgi:hypothetical protein